MQKNIKIAVACPTISTCRLSMMVYYSMKGSSCNSSVTYGLIISVRFGWDPVHLLIKASLSRWSATTVKNSEAKIYTQYPVPQSDPSSRFSHLVMAWWHTGPTKMHPIEPHKCAFTYLHTQKPTHRNLPPHILTERDMLIDLEVILSQNN